MIASAALWLWPLVSFAFFNRYALALAACLTIIGGFLFLPNGVGVDLPMLPRLNKMTIPTIAAVLLTMVAIRQERATELGTAGWIPRSIVVRLLLLSLLLGVLGTVLTNRDSLVYGTRFLPGHDLYDAASMSMSALVTLAPFFLGYRVFSSLQAQQTLLKAIVFFALGYSILALYEVRMSPVLHLQVYGYTHTNFLGQIRGDSWRPYVFVGTGLILSLFFAFSILAAASLSRAAQGIERLLWAIAILWLLGVLVLCKSLGALLITMVLLPIVLVLKPRTQLLAAFCIAVGFVTFPMLRSTGLVPVEQLLSFIEGVSPDRAQSFGYRLWNEDMLLEKAMERPVFGWGIWGRQRVYAEDGFNLSTTDGSWVIELGSGGWVRYVSLFGLMAWPVIAMFFRRRDEIDPFCIGLVFILSAKMVDLIPNAGVDPTIWLIVGALTGRLEVMSQQGQVEQGEVPAVKRKLRHARGAGDVPAYARTFEKTEKRGEHQTKARPSRKRFGRLKYTQGHQK